MKVLRGSTNYKTVAFPGAPDYTFGVAKGTAYNRDWRFWGKLRRLNPLAIQVRLPLGGRGPDPQGSGPRMSGVCSGRGRR